ncbi:MAG: hypothetical protein H6825_05705 [Planctomycetes bacterium]|nr:hypothetical protein [Planctomycetota bacterium]
MTSPTVRSRTATARVAVRTCLLRVLPPLLVLLALPACGGGGGGGGTASSGDPLASGNVTFLGIAFRTSAGVESSTPPIEDLSAVPPTLGASLDVTIVFRFDGVPAAPFDQISLPVYTTPGKVTPAAGAVAASGNIPAKGSYVRVGTTVEFRPFVPTAPLQIALSAPAASVPGFLPASTYVAKITTVGAGALSNLGTVAAPTSVEFSTTSNAAAYYLSGTGTTESPALVAVSPAEGAHDFYPGTYSATALGAASPTFPPGDDSFVLTYAQPVAPLTANLQGSDVDHDGFVDPNFFLRWTATRLLVAREVPAGAFGPFAAFPALLALDDQPGTHAASDGADVIVHGSLDGALPSPDAGFDAAPVGLACAADPDLLFALLPPAGGGTRLVVVGHVLGDPRFAELALDAEGGTPAALDTGLADAVAPLVLLDGRLLVFDRDTRSVVELVPTFDARRPLPGDVALQAPLLLAVEAGDGSPAFRSQPWTSGAAADLDVLSLAQAPSGALWALARPVGGSLPSLVRLVPVDSDLDGEFEPDEALPDGSDALPLAADYTSVTFVDETHLLALDGTAGVVDRVDLDSGVAERIADGLGGATCLAQGQLGSDTDVTLVSNGSAGAVLTLRPTGVLPFGTPVRLMQRNVFSTLYGVSELNASPGSRVSPLGAVELVSVETATPVAGASAPVDDVFLEPFVDTSNRSPSPLVTSPPADWASKAGGASGALRALAGTVVSNGLGDFVPAPLGSFKSSDAYVRASAPWPNHGPDDKEELDLDWAKADWKVVLLSTDAQNFPLADGSTPGVTSPTTVVGGQFVFRDFIIPEGVRVVVKGSNPLRITATRKVEIRGVLDVSGTDGLGDDSFDSGFLSVPGGPGGPGGGRGGDAHPTLFDPGGPGTIDQYVTPERAERGFGPVLGKLGSVSMQRVGGWGGVSTAGYDPDAAGIPKVPLPNLVTGAVANNEYHRPPGGGGGSMYQRGQTSHTGSGSYLIQSDSTWFPFSKCPVDDDVRSRLYGNDENFWSGVQPNTPLQCAYLLGTPEDPDRIRPGTPPGDAVFVDDDVENDYIGLGGEVPVPIGGQGGGGGGTRVDSIDHRHWSIDSLGSPDPFGPPYYPILSGGVSFSPTLLDAKGGAGGGGGGCVVIDSLGDVLVTRTGHIDASGGHGGGGETVQNSNVAGGGGGGSGGAVLLRAAGRIVIEGDEDHLAASYIDKDGDQGASIEVSGGFGRDAQTDTPNEDFSLTAFTYDFTRSDGGSGGMGLIQLQEGGDDGVPDVEQGAFLFAKQRTVAKLGSWTGDSLKQVEHPDWVPNGNQPNVLRYIDMLHYPLFDPENGPNKNHYYVLNGSFPPLIPRTSASYVEGFENTYGGAAWLDTTMTQAHTDGRWAVREPKPVRVMKTYAGYDPTTFKEIGSPPGSTYAPTDEIPLTVIPNEPDGTPHVIEVAGSLVFDPATIVDRLPVIPLGRAPPPFGQASHGVSRWLDFQGVRGRLRADDGRTPPFFRPLHGTYNPGVGAVPSGKDGLVALGAKVPTLPAHYVLNAPPFDPGLFGGGLADPPYNDVAVDAPDLYVDDALSDNATVRVIFQGAYAVRPGSSVPDPDTATEWVSDLTQLDGYPLVRFAVVFDLGADLATYPFSSDSSRPQVDSLRLRVGY